MWVKNGFVCKTECNHFSGKVPQKNIVYIRPGTSCLEKSAYTPKEYFKLLFTDELINLVLIYTNQEIQRQRENYKNKTSANLSNLTLSELNALFGLLILAAASNHLTTNLLLTVRFMAIDFVKPCRRKDFFF